MMRALAKLSGSPSQAAQPACRREGTAWQSLHDLHQPHSGDVGHAGIPYFLFSSSELKSLSSSLVLRPQHPVDAVLPGLDSHPIGA